MPPGFQYVTIKDSNDEDRLVKYFSDNGALDGNLTPAGGNYVTEVTVDVAVTVKSYTDGQVMGAAIELDGVGMCAGVGVSPMALALFCKDAVSNVPIDVVLLRDEPSNLDTIVDGSTFALNAADYDNLIDIIHVSEWSYSAGPSFAKAEGLSMPFKLGDENKAWAVVVAKGSIGITTVGPGSMGLTLKSMSEG